MLVTFSCKAHENTTMFGNVAVKLLTLMGNSGTVPGALLADDVPDALARLQQSIAQGKQTDAGNKPLVNDDNEPEVSLAHRAIPLIKLLQSAVKSHCNVMWDKG